MTFVQKMSWGAIALCMVMVVLIWWPIVVRSHGVLTVSFLDVGQGDAIFIESPTGRQVLIDGGKADRAVLRELGAVMPWNDRTIDVVVPTHPDADHVGGLVDVLDRFQVSYVIQSSVMGDTDLWHTLQSAIAREGPIKNSMATREQSERSSHRMMAMRGQIIDIGGGAFLEILFPDRDVSGLETNMGSVVARLVYGDTSFMLTGDSPIAIEKYLTVLDGGRLKSNVLKAGHHGSRTSSDPDFIAAVDPSYGVFSRGCDNTYGHPHSEVVQFFSRLHIQTFDTCKDGRITFTSDGVSIEER
jgi:competence protein ComEC